MAENGVSDPGLGPSGLRRAGDHTPFPDLLSSPQLEHRVDYLRAPARSEGRIGAGVRMPDMEGIMSSLEREGETHHHTRQNRAFTTGTCAFPPSIPPPARHSSVGCL